VSGKETRGEGKPTQRGAREGKKIAEGSRTRQKKRLDQSAEVLYWGNCQKSSAAWKEQKGFSSQRKEIRTPERNSTSEGEKIRLGCPTFEWKVESKNGKRRGGWGGDEGTCHEGGESRSSRRGTFKRMGTRKDYSSEKKTMAFSLDRVGLKKQDSESLPDGGFVVGVRGSDLRTEGRGTVLVIHCD